MTPTAVPPPHAKVVQAGFDQCRSTRMSVQPEGGEGGGGEGLRLCRTLNVWEGIKTHCVMCPHMMYRANKIYP